MIRFSSSDGATCWWNKELYMELHACQIKRDKNNKAASEQICL